MAVLEALSIIFLATTMIQTRRAKVAIWKSSSLASMCALSEESKSFISALRSPGEGFEKAMDLEVRLEQYGRDNWKMVSEDPGAY